MIRFAVALLVLLCAAAPASAATVSVGSNILFIADPGEANDVSVTHAVTTFTITDAGAPLTAGTGCTQLGPNQVDCPDGGLIGWYVDLNDGNDRVSLSSSGPLLPANISGGDGGDELRGSGLADTIDGGAGNDVLDGTAGGDTFYGGADWDKVDYAPRVNPVVADPGGGADDGEAGEGDDIGSDVEEIHGGAGNDTLRGTGMDESLRGGPGADTLDAGAGIDTLEGNDGADTLLGGDDNDTLLGGNDGDTLDGGPGGDIFSGDAGGDQLLARDGESDGINCGADADTAVLDASSLDTADPECETVDWPGGAGPAPGPAPAPSPVAGPPLEPAPPATPSAFVPLAAQALLPAIATLPRTAVARPVVVTATGAVPVPVACPASAVRGCRGELVLTLPVEAVKRKPKAKRRATSARHRRLVPSKRRVGRRKYSVAAGRSLPVRVALSAEGRKLVAGRKRVAAVATLLEDGPAGEHRATQIRVTLDGSKLRARKGRRR